MDPLIREMPEWFGQAGGATNIHPVGLSVLIIMGVLMVLLPRRFAILPCLFIACFIPSAQNVNFLGLDFNFLRLMVFFGFFRLMLRAEYISFRWTGLDKALIIYFISATIVFVAQQGSFSAFINRIGYAFEMLGMYFLFRVLIRDWKDMDAIVKSAIGIALPLFFFFMIENRTGRNFFSIFGGVPEITQIREGKLRCQGPYSHPILAGCFWASLLPLIAAYAWKSTYSKWIAGIGIFCAIGIILFCSSSTPIAGVLAALIGMLIFPFRRHMRLIRWAIVCLLFFLHMIMKGPVWSLVARFSAVGGGTGYHRFVLIDGAIRHFREWALLGTLSTAHWGWGAQDVTNQYVLEAVRGGLITLIFFLTVIVIGFKRIGYLWRQQKPGSYSMILSWALGVSLLVHCINFIGVSYFGQIFILWNLTLASIGSLAYPHFIKNASMVSAKKVQSID